MATYDQVSARSTNASLAKMTTPYTVLTKVIAFPDRNQEFWWNTYGPMLSELLIASKYDVHLQYQYLTFFYTHVVPSLGPRPIPGAGFFFPTTITGGQPVEMSINFQRGKSTVRYTFEPISDSSRDAFNNIMVRETLNRFSRGGNKFDQRIYDHFTNALALGGKDSEAVLQNKELVNALPSLSQQAIALDLKDQIYVKLYSFPQAKSAISGVSTAKLTFDSIRDWYTDDAKNISSAVSILQEYFDFPVQTSGSNAPPSSGAFTLFSACDLSAGIVSSQPSRAKVYVTDLNVNFARVEALWTLDGRLSSDQNVIMGLDFLRELWRLLKVPDYVVKFPAEDGVKGVRPPLYNYEIHAYSPTPVPKIYIPLIGLNDGDIVDGLTTFFKQMGWSEHAKSYGETLKRVYAGHDLSERTDAQAWISFSYSSKTGPYLTSYIYALDCA